MGDFLIDDSSHLGHLLGVNGWVDELVPGVPSNELWKAFRQLSVGVYHVLHGPIQVGGGQVDRVKPESQGKCDRVLQ